MRTLAISFVVISSILTGCIIAEPRRGDNRGDRDRDGVPNRVDRDRDGDGVPNRQDRRPDDPRRY